MKLSGNEELHYFKKQVVQKIKGYPFYFDSGGQLDQQYVSLYQTRFHTSTS